MITIINITVLLLILTFIYVSYCDFKTRIIPNKVHLIIIVLAIIQNGIQVEKLLALIIMPLPFFIAEMKKEGSFGGGDIKFIGACSFYFGMEISLLSIIVGLSLAIILNFIMRKKFFPLVPYLSFGYTIAYMIS